MSDMCWKNTFLRVVTYAATSMNTVRTFLFIETSLYLFLMEHNYQILGLLYSDMLIILFSPAVML